MKYRPLIQQNSYHFISYHVTEDAFNGTHLLGFPNTPYMVLYYFLCFIQKKLYHSFNIDLITHWVYLKRNLYTPTRHKDLSLKATRTIYKKTASQLKMSGNRRYRNIANWMPIWHCVTFSLVVNHFKYKSYVWLKGHTEMNQKLRKKGLGPKNIVLCLTKYSQSETCLPWFIAVKTVNGIFLELRELSLITIINANRTKQSKSYYKPGNMQNIKLALKWPPLSIHLMPVKCYV